MEEISGAGNMVDVWVEQRGQGEERPGESIQKCPCLNIYLASNVL